MTRKNDMQKMLNIGSMKLPKASATKGFGFIGKRGSGKSYGAAVFAEELYKTKVPFVVFDPIDVWWGLKVLADGKGKGLPIVVFGKEHADVQLDRTMGKRIAEAVVKHNISCVISTFGMNKTEMREVVADFSERLLQLNNTPRQVIIEEAHEFVPQRVQGAMARCFSAVEALLVMGRNRGIGVTLLNQRMATLNKDLLTQIDVLVAFRSVGPQDRKAFRDWVEVHNEENDEHFNEFMRSVPALKTGSAWVWSPEFLEKFELVKFRARETFHPDREKLGMTFKMPEIKQGDVQAFIDAFGKKPDPKETRKPGRVQTVIEDDRGVKAETRQYELGREYKRGFGEGELSGIEKGRRDADAKYKVLVNKCKQILMRTHGDIDRAMALFEVESVAGVRVAPPGGLRSPAAPPAQFKTMRVAVTAESASPMVLGDLKPIVGKGKRMMEILASRYPMKFTRSQLALQIPMVASGGGFGNYLSAAKTNGYIVEENGLVQATDAGIEFAGVSPAAPKTAEEIRAMWRDNLVGKGKDMFEEICASHPYDVSKEDLAQRVGMEVSGGGFGNYLSTMKSNGLITINREGFIRASEDLFKL